MTKTRISLTPAGYVVGVETGHEWVGFHRNSRWTTLAGSFSYRGEAQLALDIQTEGWTVEQARAWGRANDAPGFAVAYEALCASLAAREVVA